MSALLIPIALGMGWVPCAIASLWLMDRWGGANPPLAIALARFAFAILLGPIGLLLLGLAWVAVGRGE